MLHTALHTGAIVLPEEVIKRAFSVASPLTQVGFALSRDVLFAAGKTAEFGYRNILKPALSLVLPLQSDTVYEEHTRFTQTRSKAARLVRAGRKAQQPIARKLRKVHAGLSSGAAAFTIRSEDSGLTAVHNLASNLAILEDPHGFKVTLGLQSSLL